MVSSTVSSTPAFSPANTRFWYSLSKYCGCLASASDSAVPLAMSAPTDSSRFCMRMFFWPPATMPKACTIGMPDCIMVASWREKMAMSCGVMVLPAWPNSGLATGFTVGLTMPRLRSSRRSAFSDLADSSPFILMPRLSTPLQLNCFRMSSGRAWALLLFAVAEREAAIS